jgi:hypothetical protein
LCPEESGNPAFLSWPGFKNWDIIARINVQILASAFFAKMGSKKVN